MNWRLRIFLLALGCSPVFAEAANAPDPGASAPVFSLGQIDSDHATGIADFKGKVVLLDFWASWCGPCRESLPLYEKLRQEFGRGDFEVLAVNLDEKKADAQHFLQQHPVSYPIVHDADGDVAKLYSLPGMPTAYLVDRAGVVRVRKVGFSSKDYESLRATIKQCIGGGACGQ